MSKFSEFPRFILYDFFNTILQTYTGTVGGHFHGPMTGILIKPAYWTDMYIEASNGELVGYKFHIISINNNVFVFDYGGPINSENDIFEVGSNVYLRKDSILHKYIGYNTDTIGNYSNTGKTFGYFGEISFNTNGYYNISINTLKDFVEEGLPLNNRTNNIKEFINVCFDKVYSEIYGLQKRTPSMYDAKEIDINYLNYMANTYNMPVDNISSTDMPELSKREWVDTMIFFLKRKGTYAALYIIWKLLLTNTLNTLKVYELWHHKDLTGVPYGNFYEVPYETYYNVAPSGCSDINSSVTGYYNSISPSGYPLWSGTGEAYTNVTSITPTDMVLSPHYKVEIDLTCEPLGSDYIIDEDTIDDLLYYWNYTKPVSKFAHYQPLISPLTNFSSNYISLYDNTYSANMDTVFTGSAFASGGAGDVDLRILPGAISQTIASSTWNIYHDLNSSDVISQCYNRDNELILPEKIDIIDENTVQAVFGEAVSGKAFSSTCTSASSGYIHNQSVSSSIWNIEHNLSIREVIIQVYDSNNEMIIPESTTITDNNNAVLLFGDDLVTGTAYVKIPDYVETGYSVTGSSTWSTVHDLNSAGLIAQFYDENGEQILPYSFKIIDSNQCYTTWKSSVTGIAVFKIIERDWTQNGIMNTMYSWKVGTGGSINYNAALYNDISEEVANGLFLRQYSDVNYYYIDFEIQKTAEDINITEIGLFSDLGNIMFYSSCATIHKPAELRMTFHYRISKEE